MNVLLIQETYLPMKGGAEFHVYYLAKQLLNKNINVEIITASESSKKEDNGEICKVNRYNLKSGIKKLFMFPLWFLRIIRHAIKKDVLHAHYTSYLAFVTFIVAKILGKRFVVTLHGLGTLDSSVGKSFVKKLFRYCSIRFADCVIATSDEMRRVALRYTSEDKISIIENGVDTSFFSLEKEKEFSLDVLKFATVRRLVPKNGVHFFAQALAFYLKNDISFFWKVVGYRDLIVNIKESISSAQLEDNVEYLGALDHRGVKNTLNSVDFVVFLSTAESTSLAALEAMACGCIVISSNAGAFPEFIQDGKTGFIIDIFEEGNSDYNAPLKLEDWQYKKIREKILEIKDMRKEELLEISNNARKYVVSNYDWSKIVDKTIRLAYTKENKNDI